MCAEFYQREPSGVLALATVGAVKVRIIDVSEACRLELGVFHVRRLQPAGCGLPLYKSYSVGAKRVLYKADAASLLDGRRVQRRSLM
jgi:hypothetical protein